MAIITISRGSYSKGREVAEKTALRLGYQVISHDILLEASDRFNTPEVKLVRAIHDAPTILERLGHSRQSYLSYIRSALTARAREDNLVYHGLAGHVFFKGVPHVLKVRILADLDARVAAEMKREHISEAEARHLLLKDDEERRKWSQAVYGVDHCDASLYDLVIHIHKLTVEDAVEYIVHAVGRQSFSTTPQSQAKMDDLALACAIKASLVQQGCFDLTVNCEFGNVVVYTHKGGRHAHGLDHKLAQLQSAMPAINHLEVREGLPAPPAAV